MVARGLWRSSLVGSGSEYQHQHRFWGSLKRRLDSRLCCAYSLLRTIYCKIARKSLMLLRAWLTQDATWIDAFPSHSLSHVLICNTFLFYGRKPTDRFQKLLGTDRICRWPSGVELYQRPMTCVVFRDKKLRSNSIQRRSSYLGDSLKV